LFGESEVRSYIHAVAQLQDLLGAHNDAVSVERCCRRSRNRGRQGAKLQDLLGWLGEEPLSPTRICARAGRRSSEQEFSGAESSILINAMNFNRKCVDAKAMASTM